jgi:hypothetical protein
LSFNGSYASTTMAGIYGNGATASSLYYEVPSGQSHFFGIADSTKLTLDSSGNLGLGVTPSAWDSAFKAFDINTNGSLFASSATTQISSNAYYATSSYRYKASGKATLYVQSSDTASHAWYLTNTSGTAGNAISFTQAMTLTSGGDLQLGTTSSTFGNKMTIVGGAGGDAYLTVGDGTRTGYIGSNGTEVNIGSYSNTPVTFNTNDTERARIDSSGNLNVIANISRNGGSASSDSLSTKFNGSTEQGLGALDSTDTTDAFFAIFRKASGGSIASIRRVGTTDAVIYNTTSDYRLKTVLGSVTGQGERIDALQPIQYEWKSNGARTRGFLAHQFQEVYSSSVSGAKDAVDEQGNPLYQAMQAGTSEVIADLVAEIQSLRQRLSAANL